MGQTFVFYLMKLDPRLHSQFVQESRIENQARIETQQTVNLLFSLNGTVNCWQAKHDSYKARDTVKRDLSLALNNRGFPLFFLVHILCSAWSITNFDWTILILPFRGHKADLFHTHSRVITPSILCYVVRNVIHLFAPPSNGQRVLNVSVSLFWQELTIDAVYHWYLAEEPFNKDFSSFGFLWNAWIWIVLFAGW